jgi:hypothetical protein
MYDLSILYGTRPHLTVILPKALFQIWQESLIPFLTSIQSVFKTSNRIVKATTGNQLT